MIDYQNTNEWINNNTFHHNQFSDINKLVHRKNELGIKISLCIPTLNEEKTIGKELIIFKSELVDKYQLIDEITVIDSGSTDKTLEIASNHGVKTYFSGDILPDYGFKKGKGENLWKSIYQLSGDIICYVDADIKNVDSRFITGLIGPLIYREEIKYVKAFYERPLEDRGKIYSSGGGRVTEILVRPMFSVFFPELTALIQPLSGEYAVRREVLESISFPTGYGVETSHLIDLYQLEGLNAFAQTNMEKRIHRNRDISQLGRMSFVILQTFLNRLLYYNIFNKESDLNTIFHQFKMNKDYYLLSDYELTEEFRPPMKTIEEYRKKNEK